LLGEPKVTKRILLYGVAWPLFIVFLIGTSTYTLIRVYHNRRDIEDDDRLDQ
jgi:hypothetical protein